MDEGKSVERMAAEIDRRFLSVYLPGFAEARRDYARRELAQQHARRVAERLAKAAGGKLSSNDRFSATEYSVWTEGGPLRVTASDPDRAHVEARISVSDDALAIRVARALRKKKSARRR